MRKSKIYPATAMECIAHYEKVAVRDERVTEKTKYGYIFGIKRITAILEDAKLQTLPYKIGKREISYLEREFSCLAIRTQRWYMCMLNRYLTFYNNNAISEDGMRWPRDERIHVDWLSPEQAKTLLSYPMTLEQEVAIKLELCLGLRRVEVIRLRVQDIHPTYLNVRGKGRDGGKWRSVPYPDDEFYELLSRYIRKRNIRVREYSERYKSYKEPDALFLQIKKKPLPYSEKGNGFDEVIIEPLREQIGFHFSNHTLRRTMARQLYIYNNVPIVEISKILGHEDSKTTIDYIGVNLDDMSNSMRKLKF